MILSGPAGCKQFTLSYANWRISLLGDEMQQKEEVLFAVVQQLSHSDIFSLPIRVDVTQIALLGGQLSMRRIQLIELHEQSWFPSSLRDEITDALQFGVNFLEAYAPIAPLLQRMLNSTRSRTIVDMCSGAGGPWLTLCRKLQPDGQAFHILLTDKYPNFKAFQKAALASENRIAFYPGSVDAMRIPGEFHGFRTMFSAFHHFPPDEARTILQNAVDARQSIGIFEITGRAPFPIALMFPWALLPFVLTPLVRPFRLLRVVCTYVIPIIPLVLLFDGVVSCLRTYGPQELREIIKTLSGTEYRWEVGKYSKASGQAPITYLIGSPRSHV